MSTVRVAVTQVALKGSTADPVETIRRNMLAAHLALVEEAASKGVQVISFQEVFNQPYFCPVNDPKWFAAAEPVDGPTIQALTPLARKHAMVIVAPIYELAPDGKHYNTAVVIDADGRVLGTYQKIHIPGIGRDLHGMIPKGERGDEKFWFADGTKGWPVFRTRYLKLGVYICYDRHFPEGWRALGLNGAEYVVNPSATMEGLSRHLWHIEQPAAAVANGFFVGANNRVGDEAPWNIGRFYGSSYVVDPKGRILAQGPDDRDALVIADIDLAVAREVRDTWRFYEHRRPETYAPLSARDVDPEIRSP
jgi:beta-ureidopropionase